MSRSVLITLDTNEYADVVRRGVEQTLDSLLSNRKGSHGISTEDNESYDIRIRGAIGEHVVSRYLQLPILSLKDPFGREDLLGIDVKTAAEIGDSLIIRDNVSPELVLVLVTPGIVRPLHWIIWGWIPAEEGRKVGKRTNFGAIGRPKVWAVSHTALYDIRDLSDLVIPFRVSEDSSLLGSASN